MAWLLGRTFISMPTCRIHFHMHFDKRIRWKQEKIEKTSVFPRQPTDEVEHF